MMRTLLFIFGSLIAITTFAQYDWDEVPVPAEADNTEISWELVEELSDDFNYESTSPQEMGGEFYNKWKDGFINNWTGPKNTYWTPDASLVTGGNLEITASRRTGTQVNFQAVTSKTKIKYPAYVETRMKIMNSVMANAVWMLNDDSTEEIDIVEGYGASYANSNGTSRDWFARRMHLSHHTFIRDPFQDYQPTDGGTWHNDGTYWRDDFRIIGVYWRDPFHLEYYIDGELVRTVSGPDIIDPHEYLGGNGLSDEETLIISGASQGWQVEEDVWPTDAELAVEEDNVFKVDWIRTYKRVDSGKYVPPTSITSNEKFNSLVFSNPVKDYISIIECAEIKQIDLYNLNGSIVKSVKVNTIGSQSIFVADLPAGIYIIKVTDNNGFPVSKKLIKH